MKEASTRRKLEFATFDDVIREVQSLQAGGYLATGKWNLAQICGHLAEWLRFPLDGYPKSILPIRLMMWVMRHTTAPGQLRKVLETKSWPAGTPTIPQTVPGVDAETDAAAVQKLSAAIDRFQKHEGEFQPSPLFGKLDRDRMTQLQLIHCAHHLSFLVPQAQL